SSSIDPPGGFESKIEWFQRDEAAPPANTQCWGDTSFYGAAGPKIVGNIDNTDPALGAHETLRGVRTVNFGGTPVDPALVDDAAAAWSSQIANPLVVTVGPA